MKLQFFILVVFGLACAAQESPDKKTLEADIEDFFKILPKDKIKTILESYSNDPEVQKVKAYLMGPKFAELVEEINAIPEYQKVVSYLESAGFSVKKWIALIREFLGLGGISAINARASSHGFKDMIEEIEGILPLEDIASLIEKKKETSPAFADMINKMKSPTFKALIETLKANIKINEIFKQLLSMEIDLKEYFDIIFEVFGIGH